MAVVAMWPPANGAYGTISVDGRTYSSVPGSSINVQDFDVAVLQANGWTTFATVAGQNYVPLTSPASGPFNTISFEGRTYSTPPGTPIDVPYFDVGILQANGWTQVFGTVLQTLSLSANTFKSGAAHGTVIGNILNTTTGSTVAISAQSNANALQVAQSGGTWQLQVGSSAPVGANSFTVTLQETLSGATNSPSNTGPLGVTENAASGALFDSATSSAFIAAVAA